MNEGIRSKFVTSVEQVTFNAGYGLSNGTEIMYITERTVFVMTREGLKLTEVAPGVRLQEDVLDRMEFKPLIDSNVKTMNSDFFS